MVSVKLLKLKKMSANFVKFKDRVDAGRRLAEELLLYKNRMALVLAIPRGGVVVAYEIAKALEAPLDLIVPRKIGIPGNPELAIGAITEDGTTVLNNYLISMLGISKEYIRLERQKQIKEIRRRVNAYRGGRPPQSLMSKTAILVDDGVATGATMRAAIYSTKKQGASKIIVAVPVAAPDTHKKLAEEVDKVICLVVFEPFFAIGQFYDDFSQLNDEEVIRLLELSRK